MHDRRRLLHRHLLLHLGLSRWHQGLSVLLLGGSHALGVAHWRLGLPRVLLLHWGLARICHWLLLHRRLHGRTVTELGCLSPEALHHGRRLPHTVHRGSTGEITLGGNLSRVLRVWEHRWLGTLHLGVWWERWTTRDRLTEARLLLLPKIGLLGKVCFRIRFKLVIEFTSAFLLLQQFVLFLINLVMMVLGISCVCHSGYFNLYR